MLSLLSVLYLCSLPLGWKSYREQERALAASTAVVPVDPIPVPAAYVPPTAKPDDPPVRLN